MKSKFGAALEPFSENNFLLYRKPNQALFTITGCQTSVPHWVLREDIRLFSYGSLMVEGLDFLCHDEDPDPDIYLLLKNAFGDLEIKNPSSTTWLFMFRLLKYAGYRLDFFSCSSCRKKDFEEIYFSPGQGGVLCAACRSKDELCWKISRKTVNSIRRISPERVLDGHSEKEIGNIIKKFIKYQFGKDLKTMGFLENVFSGINRKTEQILE